MKSIPSKKDVEEKYALIKSNTKVKKLKKTDVDSATKDLEELVKGLSNGLTDDDMVGTLSSYGHSYAAIRAAEQRLVNKEMMIGRIVPKSKYGDWRDGTKKYFWNDNNQGEKNGRENTHKR